MTIYLNRQYGLGVDLIGYALTSALTIGVVFSLGFGILADKFDKALHVTRDYRLRLRIYRHPNGAQCRTGCPAFCAY